MELGKVPSSTEKGKDRKNSKEEEGDRFGFVFVCFRLFRLSAFESTFT